MEADKYGKGRLSVIAEMIDFCNKEIAELESKGSFEGDFRSITRGGMVKAYKRVIEKLEVKRKKTLDYE